MNEGLNKYNSRLNINRLSYAALLIIATNNLNINCAAKPDVSDEVLTKTEEVLEERRQATISQSSSSTQSGEATPRPIDSELINKAYRGDKEKVESLIKRGANVNCFDCSGWTALMHAAYMVHKEIVKLLIDSGADVNAARESGNTALMVAVRNGCKDMVQLLAENKASVDVVDDRGETALMIAIYHKDIAQLLINKSANVNAVDRDGWTALMKAACGKGYRDIVQSLIDACANVNAANKYGETVLMKAVERGHKDTVELLLYAGAYIDKEDKEAQKAIDYARKEYSHQSEDVKESKRQIVKLLEDEPARRAKVIDAWANIVAKEIGAATDCLIPPLVDLVSQYAANYEDIPLPERLKLSFDLESSSLSGASNAKE